MQRNTTTVRTLLSALLLSAGIASPIALGDEPTAEGTSHEITPSQSVEESGHESLDKEREGADLVEVRVSLPDGRTIVRLEPKRAMSARYNARASASTTGTSRRLADGSLISVAPRGVSGGSNSSSMRSGGSSGGGGGGGVSSRGGGGGSASSLSVSGGASSHVSDGVDGAGDTVKRSGGGVFSYGSVKGGVQQTADTRETAQESGSILTLGSPNADITDTAGGGVQTNSGAEHGAQTPRPVSTVGNPNYDREGNASGGQRVEFHDAGMSAAVIGNRIYFQGVELVSANQPFEVITGTRIADDSVIMDETRLDSSRSDVLSSFDTRSSAIKIELESGTTVDLVLLSRSSNPNSPERELRTWTVRIR